jgi:hypothetical protein
VKNLFTRGSIAGAVGEAQRDIIPAVLAKIGEPRVGKKYKSKAIQLIKKLLFDLDIEYNKVDTETGETYAAKLLLPESQQLLLDMLQTLESAESSSSSSSSSSGEILHKSSSPEPADVAIATPVVAASEPVTATVRLSEAAERNRAKQLAEKAKAAEATRLRNEEIMRRYYEAQAAANKPKIKEFVPKNFTPLSVPTSVTKNWIDTGVFSILEITTIMQTLKNPNIVARVIADIPSTEFNETASPMYIHTVCATMILVSELSKKDASIVLKGGKAAQVANSGYLKTMTKHVSNDVDVLLLNGTQDKALRIAEFVKDMLPNSSHISMLDKTSMEQPLVKLSLTTPFMQAFLDIDYGTPMAMFYDNIVDVHCGSLFYHIQHPMNYFEEKVYYYMLYQKKLKTLNKTCNCAHPLSPTCVKDCSYHQFTFNKFLETMKASINELQKTHYASETLLADAKTRLKPLVAAAAAS